MGGSAERTVQLAAGQQLVQQQRGSHRAAAAAAGQPGAFRRRGACVKGGREHAYVCG
jgi:hypothetical protein